MKTASIAQMVVRILGLVQLVMGIFVWTGNSDSLIPAHMTLGSAMVIALWVLAYLAARAGVSTGLVAAAVVWGLVVAGWGAYQAQIIPGGAHWITQVLHLVLGIGAVGLAEMLVPGMRRAVKSV